MYSGGDLVTYDPESGAVATVGSSPAGHNRPRVLHHETARDVLLMGTQADTTGGGSLVTHDPGTSETRAAVPYPDKAISAVTSDGGSVFIGASSGMQDPNADWPGLASDGCALYVMDGTDVLRVAMTPPGRP